MKVVYANPVFLDYRLPFYKELNRLFKGDFHVIFSKERYRILGREDLYCRILDEMGDNAHPLKTDYLFDTHSMSFHMKDIEKGHHIPITFGLIRKIRTIKPDVLITEGFFQWTPLVILYSLLFRVPVYIGYERTPHTERNTGKLKTLHRKLTDKFVKGYLANGSQTKQYLESIGVNPEKIHIGGMSADSAGLKKSIAVLSEEERLAVKRKYKSDAEGLIFLFSGRMVEGKGVNHLLEAWIKHIKEYPKDKLILIGGGPLYEQLESQYKDVSSIYLEGSIPYQTVCKYYAIADVFILPTLQDNWSLVVPEAMACGLPVATSVYNGCYPELVHEGRNGYVFDTLDSESILKALAYFHSVNLKDFGEESKAIEKEFDTEHCAYRVYKALIEIK